MNELERLLSPVSGYLTLGMHQDAWDLLGDLSPELRIHDAVLGLRLEILQHLEKWESARVLAESLAKRSPENPDWWLSWSYALRRERSVEAAQAVLREASEIHSDVALITYNLACYACILDDLAATRTLLKIAFAMDPALKQTALDDSDLDPIFGEISSEHIPVIVPPHMPESAP
jgi:hypothetical protein